MSAAHCASASSGATMHPIRSPLLRFSSIHAATSSPNQLGTSSAAPYEGLETVIKPKVRLATMASRAVWRRSRRSLLHWLFSTGRAGPSRTASTRTRRLGVSAARLLPRPLLRAAARGCERAGARSEGPRYRRRRPGPRPLFFRRGLPAIPACTQAASQDLFCPRSWCYRAAGLRTRKITAGEGLWMCRGPTPAAAMQGLRLRPLLKVQSAPRP